MVLVLTADADGEIYTRIECRGGEGAAE
jgi:hypothetical protein